MNQSVPVTNAAATVEIPAGQIDKYNLVCTRLTVLQRKKEEYMSQGFSEENVLLKENNDLTLQARELKKKMEAENPGLANLGAAALASNGQAAAADDGPGQIRLLESKEMVLNQKLNQLRSEWVRVGEVEPKIKDLTRKETYQEENLMYFTKSLEDAKINESLGAGKITGIKPIQLPTPVHPADTKRLKTAGMFLGGGIFGALALAFLIELVLDRSINRAVEIETKLTKFP